jgi:hypothetical protein
VLLDAASRNWELSPLIQHVGPQQLVPSAQNEMVAP